MGQSRKIKSWRFSLALVCVMDVGGSSRGRGRMFIVGRMWGCVRVRYVPFHAPSMGGTEDV